MSFIDRAIKKFTTRPMSSHSTPRQCSSCLQGSKGEVHTAVNWKYALAIDGSINESSRVPVCIDHS